MDARADSHFLASSGVGSTSPALPSPRPVLPEAVIRIIASLVIDGDTSGSMLINLMSLCGVCTQWRRVCREVDATTSLSFDGMDVSFSNNHNVQRFRRASAQQKQEFFVNAARLLTGYHRILLSGEGITDRLLEVIARQSNRKLQHVSIHSANAITDSGLKLLTISSPDLRSLSLSDLKGSSVEGHFLVTVFENCSQLTTLSLSHIPAMNWQNAVCCPGGLNLCTKQLRSLNVRSVNGDTGLDIVIAMHTQLEDLQLDGSPLSIHVAAITCARLESVSYMVSSKARLDEALSGFQAMPSLRRLELVVKELQLSRDQLARIGAIPVHDLRLLSYAYKQQPTLSSRRSGPYSDSHIDNEGVKALVDAICSRWSLSMTEVTPLRLSLCGATSLTHDAVSILLRLPILTDLDITGCCRISATDKMRLVAKVRAGQERWSRKRAPLNLAV